VKAAPFSRPLGFAGRIASFFIDSKLTPIVVAASLLMGAFAALMLPREEEPQIKVPMIDVLVAMPGATAHEVENQLTRPMEKLLWEIPGVEYLYSTASRGANMTVVRFKVGTDLEAALVRLNQKLQANFDRIPLGVTPPLIKPRTIDDVPILALTLHSARYDHATLHRLATQLVDTVKTIPQVAETTVIGGQPESAAADGARPQPGRVGADTPASECPGARRCPIVLEPGYAAPNRKVLPRCARRWRSRRGRV
jgi:multidrug efflux pump subunit AcrB